MSQTIEKAQSVISDRLSEIDAERKQLQRALQSLGSGPAKRRPTSRRATATARAPRGQRRQQVLAHLEANPSARPAEIAKAIDTSANQVHGLIRKLLDQKLVRKSGKGYRLAKASQG